MANLALGSGNGYSARCELANCHQKIAGVASKTLHPVLILSPFRCPPGPIRSEWFDKYHKWLTASPKSKEAIPCLVYWYGAYTCGQSSARPFSFVPLSKIVSYEDGVKKGHDKLPPELLARYHQKESKKAKKGGTGRLSVLQDWLICGHWEVRHALQLSPSKRWGGMQDFEEDYADDFEYYRECVEEEQESSSNNGSAAVESEASEDENASRNENKSIASHNGADGIGTIVENRNEIAEKAGEKSNSDGRARVKVPESDDDHDDTDGDSDSTF